MSCLALTLGALLLALNSSYRREVFAPGKLTTQHSQLLSGADVENRCASCHPAGNQTTGEWFVRAVGLASTNPASDEHAKTQTELCMRCHDKSINPNTATLAHNVPAQALNEITSQKTQNRIQLVSFASPANEKGELACSACHREHHGASHDLTFLTNAQCQNCHADQFESFEHGHPEFDRWPYDRRQRIAFNHATHSGKHFKKESREFNCSECHKTDGENDVISVTSYTACAECHEQKMGVSLAEGVGIFKLPLIDTEALLDAGHDIGQWPNKADGEFDGTLPEVMKLLLSADENARNAFELLGSDFDFYDTDPDDEDQMEAVASLIWSIKRLLNDLSLDAETAWKRRISAALRQDLSATSLQHLHASFSEGYYALSADKWFLDLAEDVRLEFGEESGIVENDARVVPHLPGYAVSQATVPEVEPAGEKRAWHVNNDRFEINYYPQGHNDTFLAATLDLLAKTDTQVASDIVEDCRAVFMSDSSIGNCVSCHSVDQLDASNAVNWQARRGKPAGSGFTKFSHSEHLIQPNLSDCIHCHKIDPTAEFAAGYAPDAAHGVSNFSPVAKSSCVECHNQVSHKDACTTCHQYHVHPNGLSDVQSAMIAELPLRSTDTRK